MKKDFINVLWIEDNPRLSTSKTITIDGNEFEIPAIIIDDISEKNFRLKILQHPKEIKEYLTLCHEVILKYGFTKLGMHSEIIPDIIVFDYMLNENFSGAGINGISRANAFKPIREMFNPSFVICKEFPALFKDYILFSEAGENYKASDFIREINGDIRDDDDIIDSDKEKLRQDEFGLYAGITIVRFFKEYVTCGLPATFNKGDRSSLEPSAKYFEWLNEFDLKTALRRQNRGSKNWNEVINDGVELLRGRIEDHVKTGTIVPSLQQLAELASGKMGKGVFTFSSRYGTRDLPLDGLFVDKQAVFLNQTPGETKNATREVKPPGKGEQFTDRDLEIRKFANNLLGILLEKAGVQNNSITSAIEIAKELWSAAKGDILRERFKLSELFAKKYFSDQHLTADENELFERYCSKDYYDVHDPKDIADKIKKGSRITDHVNKRIVSIREYHIKEDENNKIKTVLATLFLAIHLHYQFKKFRMNSTTVEKLNVLSSEFCSRPTLTELLYVLFPSPRIPILMPGHLRSAGDDFKRKILDDQFQKFFSRDDSSGIGWTTLPVNLDFSNIITSGEKIICQAYAAGIGMSIDDYPHWLR